MSDTAEPTTITSSLDLHPRDVFVTEFTHAYELHQATSAIVLERNRQVKKYHPELSDSVLRQRETILDMAASILLNARDATLDKFCQQWQARRR